MFHFYFPCKLHFHSVRLITFHPQVRKAAHHAVYVILKTSSFMTKENAPPHHPLSSATAKYCIQEIELAGGWLLSSLILLFFQTFCCTGLDENSDAMHYVALFKMILPCFPHNALKSSCETLLKLMTLSNVVCQLNDGLRSLYCWSLRSWPQPAWKLYSAFFRPLPLQAPFPLSLMLRSSQSVCLQNF
jgi:hypothetical protein